MLYLPLNLLPTSLVFFEFYVVLIITVVFYTLTSTKQNSCLVNDKSTIVATVLTFLATLTIVYTASHAYLGSFWYNHLVFGNFQHKLFFINCTVFLTTVTLVFLKPTALSAEISDKLLTLFFFFLWLSSTYLANNLFTFFFFFEVLTTLIFLLLVTDLSDRTIPTNFSSNFFKSQQFFYTSSKLTSLIFFFWLSLVASILLFISLIYTYLTYFTFEWLLLEHLFTLMAVIRTDDVNASFFFTWLLFLISFFLKTGLAPFFLWKPNFFKGLSYEILVVYICYYYYILLLFFFYFVLYYLPSLLSFTYILIVQLVLLGLVGLFFFLYEATNLKFFLASSSILNTLFLLLLLVNPSDLYF